MNTPRIFLASTALAALLAAAGADGARAQPPDFFRGEMAGASGNVVGGGHREFLAGGSEMLIVDVERAGGAGALDIPVLAGRRATIVGNDGDGPQVRYLEAAPVAPGRHAHMSGGGDEMVITYGTPAGR